MTNAQKVLREGRKQKELSPGLHEINIFGDGYKKRIRDVLMQDLRLVDGNGNATITDIPDDIA